ncbi:hypothetical protein [Rathayibacter tritici]|uniref:Glycosyltransferase RgtA/B/C/D-like domain-containing protein n=1 Tax=Rathayibacter tritici TaxID=33888 RepID=A0A160KU24_9MICO|nr:hypothetical protein [Rathayibacter tritici]AND17057.1 hypothetical protein A6122_1931 [Rathayibacter tritici]PPF31122.1 hypothetical protein C5C06_02890 [Rathayibacter tritici]PPI14957.1 hypothetical protein C5D07_07910 [Rathayibacter tritici]PPI44614.1 hypothetical protein C5D18_08115 [Rathayibacter tritici]
MIIEEAAVSKPVEGRQRRHRPAILLDAGFAAVTAVLSTALGMLALRITPKILEKRWTFGGPDQVLHYTIFSSAREVFPFLPNGRLGFPAAQNLFFAPLFDPWSAVFVAVVGPLTPDGVWLLNLYSIAGFTAVGATAYVFFRALRLRRVTSVVLGVLTAVLPYHFVQLSFGHPFLAQYWAVPLIGVLLLVIGGRETDPLNRWTAGIAGRRRRRLVRAGIVVALALAIAWTQSYYFVFGAIVLGSAWVLAVLAALIRRSPVRSLAWPTLALGSFLSFIAVQLAVLSIDQGDRYEKYFQGRSAQESEFYGGKMQSLLLPSPTSGFSSLAELAQGYARSSAILPTTENPSTAVVVSAAFLLVLLIVLSALGRAGRTGAAPRSRLALLVMDARVGLLSQAFVVALLFFIVAGLGAILSYVVSPEIRAWSRMSIVLSVLALGVAGIALETLVRRRRLLFPALAVVAAVGLIDQVAGTAAAIPLAPTSDSSVRAFAQETERRLADGCGIVQLPLKDFPETDPIGNMGDYDEALPYLYSSDDGGLRYSYGAVRGTRSADDWNRASTPRAFEREYDASGACAVLVDTFAYVDDLDGWKPFVDAVADPDRPSVVSTDSDRRWLLFRTGS